MIIGNRTAPGWALRTVSAVLLWSVAFAFVEAAVVEYLRALYYPIDKGGFLFPLMTVEQFKALGEFHWRRLLIELGRELATMVMLATMAITAGRNRREAWAHFVIAFGVWDIFFYLWLKLFLDWPQSFSTWDLLFLFPLPWVGPVLAPILVSAVMILAGFTVLVREAKGSPLAATWKDWTLLAAGGLIVIVSFCLDSDNIMAGGVPNPFNWPLFLVGLGLGIGAFVRVVLRKKGLPPGK